MAISEVTVLAARLWGLLAYNADTDDTLPNEQNNVQDAAASSEGLPAEHISCSTVQHSASTNVPHVEAHADSTQSADPEIAPPQIADFQERLSEREEFIKRQNQPWNTPGRTGAPLSPALSARRRIAEQLQARDTPHGFRRLREKAAVYDPPAEEEEFPTDEEAPTAEHIGLLVLISYKRGMRGTDVEFHKLLMRALSARGYNIISNLEVNPASEGASNTAADWRATMQRSVEGCDAVVVCLSEHYLHSPYAMEELEAAHRLGKPCVLVTVPNTAYETVLDDVCNRHPAIADILRSGHVLSTAEAYASASPSKLRFEEWLKQKMPDHLSRVLSDAGMP